MADALHITDIVQQAVAAGVPVEKIRAHLEAKGYLGSPAEQQKRREDQWDQDLRQRAAAGDRDAALRVQFGDEDVARAAKDQRDKAIFAHRSMLNVVPNWLLGRGQVIGQTAKAVGDEAAALGADYANMVKNAIHPTVMHMAKFTNEAEPRRLPSTTSVELPLYPQSATLNMGMQTAEEMRQATEHGRPLDTMAERSGNLLSGFGGIVSRVLGTDVPVSQYSNAIPVFQKQEADRSFEMARQGAGSILGMPAGIASAVLHHGPQVLAYGAPDVGVLVAPHLSTGLIEAATGKPIRSGGFNKVVPEEFREATRIDQGWLEQRLQENVAKGQITMEQASQIAREAAADAEAKSARTRLSAPTEGPRPSTIGEVGNTLKRGLYGEILAGSLGAPTGVGALMGALTKLPLAQRMLALGKLAPEQVAAYRRTVHGAESNPDPRVEAQLRTIGGIAHLQQGTENLSTEARNAFAADNPQMVTDKAQGAEFVNRPGETNSVVESTPEGGLRVPQDIQDRTAALEGKGRGIATLAETAKAYAASLPKVYENVSAKLGEQLAAAKFFRKAYWMDLERKIDALKLHDQETRGMKREIYDASAAEQDALSPQFEKYRQEQIALGNKADTMFEQQRQEKYGERAGQSAERTRLANEQAARRGELMGDRQAAWADLPTRIKQAKEALKTAREEMNARHESERADMAQILREVGHREELTKAMLDHVKNDESLSDAERSEAVDEWTQKWNEAKNATEAKGGKELWDEIQKEHAAERTALNKYEREALKPNGERTMNVDEHLREHVAPHVDELVRAREAAVESVHEQHRGTREMRSQREQLASEHGRQSRASEAGRASQRSILADLREELSNQRIRLMDQAAKLKEDRATRLSNLELNRGLGREPHVASVEASKAELERVNEALRAKRGEVAAVPGERQADVRAAKGESRGFMKQLADLKTGEKQRAAAGAVEELPAESVPTKTTSAKVNALAESLHEMTQRFTQPADRIPVSWYRRVFTDPLLRDGQSKIRSPRFRGYLEGEWVKKITDQYGEEAGEKFKSSLDTALLNLDKTLLGKEPTGIKLRIGDQEISLRDMIGKASDTLERNHPEEYRKMQVEAVEHNLRSVARQAMEHQFLSGVRLLYENSTDQYRGLLEEPTRVLKKVESDIAKGDTPDVILPFEVKDSKGILQYGNIDTPAGKWLDSFVPMPGELQEAMARQGGEKLPKHLWIQKNALESIKMMHDQISGFAESERNADVVTKAMNNYLNLWKMGHTTLAPFTHIGNISGNILYDTIVSGKLNRAPAYVDMLKKFLDFEHGKEPTDPLEAGAMRRFLRQGKLRTGMMDMDVEKFTTSDKPVQGRKAQAVQWVVDLAGKTYSLGDAIPKLTNAMENFKDDVRQLNELSNGHSLTMKYVDGDLVEVAKTSDGKYKINGKNATHEQVMDAFADHAMDFPMSWTLDMTKAKGLSHMQRKMGGFGKIIGNILPYTQWFTGTIDTPFKPGLVTRALQFDNNAHFSTDPKLVKSNGLKITQGALRRLTTMSIMEGIGADTGDDKDVQARTAFGLSAGALVRQGADNRHLAINPGTNNPLVGTLVLSKVVNYITAQLGGAFALHSAVGARIAAKAKGEKAEELTPRQHAMIQAHMKATAGNIANEKDIDSMMQRGGDGMLRAFNAAWKGKVDKDVYKQEMPGRIMRVALDSVSPVLADIGDAVLGLSMPQWSTRKVFDEKGRAVDEPVPEMLTRIFFHSADRQVESSEQAKKWGANIGDKVNENLVKPLRAEMDKARAEWKRDETNMEAKEKYELAKSWHNASKRILADELNTLKKSARLGARSHGLGGIAGHEMMQMQTPAPKVEQSAEETP